MAGASNNKEGFELSKRSLDNLTGVNPILVTFVKELIKVTPVDFGILDNGGFRTAEMQHTLYLKKRSKLDGFIQISHHQLGNAVDPVPYVGGKFTWDDKKAFEAINKAAQKVWKKMDVKGVRLIWGGDWSNFYDPAHYQIVNKK